MSEVSSSATENTGSTKKPISPARNIIGLIVLIGVLIVCWFEYSALIGFRSAVRALEARAQDENQNLLTAQEAQTLLGKAPDGPATEFRDRGRKYAKTTYTWSGLIKHYTLTAYYTNEPDSRLHHYETEGSKYEAEPSVLDATSSPPPSKSSSPPSAGPPVKSMPGKTRISGTAPGSRPTIAPDSKDLPKAKGSSEKGRTPEPQPSGKPAAEGKPAEPADKGSSSKSTTTPDQAKSPQ